MAMLKRFHNGEIIAIVIQTSNKNEGNASLNIHVVLFDAYGDKTDWTIVSDSAHQF